MPGTYVYPDESKEIREKIMVIGAFQISRQARVRKTLENRLSSYRCLSLHSLGGGGYPRQGERVEILQAMEKIDVMRGAP